jgi:hypothetical protein
MKIGEWGIGVCVTRQGMETCVDRDYEAIEIVVNLAGLRSLISALEPLDAMTEGGTIVIPIGRCRNGAPCSLRVEFNPRVEPGEEVKL